MNRTNDGSPNRSEWRAVVAWIAVHAAICGVLAVLLNVWLDESFSLETSCAGLITAYRRALGFEMQPPLYFVALAAWRTISAGYVFARILSIACTALALAVVARIWMRLETGVRAGWIVAALALHPFSVYMSIEIRLYAMALLLCALSLWLFLDRYLGDRADGGSLRGKAAFAAVSFAALATQYYLGFLLAAQGAALVLLGRWRAVRGYLAAMAVATLALAPYVGSIQSQIQGHSSGVHEPFGPLTDAKFVYTRLSYFLLPRETESPRAVKRARDLVIAFAVAAGIVKFARSRGGVAVAVGGAADGSGNRSLQALAVIVALVAVAFVVAVQLVGTEDLVMMRHTVALFLPTVLLGLLLVSRLGGPRAVHAAVAVILLFDCADLATVYLPRPAKRGDWLAVARLLEARERPDQPILVFRAPVELALSVHYHGINRIIPIPKPTDRDRWSLTDTQLHSEAQVMEPIRAAGPDRTGFWLVTDTIWSAVAVDFHHEILEQAIAEHFEVVEDHPFFASRVRLLRARTPQPEQAQEPRGQ